MAFVVPAIFTAVDKMSVTVSRMAGTVRGFSDTMQSGIARGERAVRKLTPGFSDVQKEMLSFASTAAIAAGIIGTFNFSFKTLKDYDEALGSLRAITGLTGAEFDKFKNKISEVALSTGKSTIDVAKSFEILGSANSSLLNNADAMAKMSEAAIILSQASKDELAVSASSLVGVMNQFNLGADQAQRAMNVLAAGAKVGAATIPQLAESMKNVGSVSASAGISVEQTVALLETLSTKSLFGAEAGTKLRGVILALQKGGLGYKSGLFNISDALVDVNNKLANATTAKQKDAMLTKLFGAENISAGKILMGSTATIKEFTTGVTGTNEAIIQAAQNNNTLTGTISRMTAKFQNLLTTNKNTSKALNIIRGVIGFITDNMEALILSIGIFVGLMVTMRIVLFTAKAMLFAYNVVLGITSALTGRATAITAANTTAMTAQAVATKVITAAQWLWNAAMMANPIGLIIAAIIAMIALLTVAVRNWNEWGAALAFFLGPLGMIVSLIQAFRRNWNLITEAFKTEGMIAGIKMIGITLLDVVLMPLQQILEIISKVTGADWAKSAADNVNKFRSSLGTNLGNEAQGPVLETGNPAQNRAEMISRSIEEKKSQAMLSISAPEGFGTQLSAPSDFPIQLSSTRQ